jgi:hypothetical protein
MSSETKKERKKEGRKEKQRKREERYWLVPNHHHLHTFGSTFDSHLYLLPKPQRVCGVQWPICKAASPSHEPTQKITRLLYGGLFPFLSPVKLVGSIKSPSALPHSSRLHHTHFPLLSSSGEHLRLALMASEPIECQVPILFSLWA